MNRSIHVYTIAAALLAGCSARDVAPPAQGAAAEVTPSNTTAARSALPSQKDLCPQLTPWEGGHPQSRGYRGGCLENFRYFTVSENILPPGELPIAVTGHHINKKIEPVPIHLQRVGADANMANGSVTLYTAVVQAKEGPLDLCPALIPTDKHDKRVVAVPGTWDMGTGKHQEDVGGKKVFTLSCLSGAIAKCVLWGFAPWRQHQSMSLQDTFLTCIPAARAQYDFNDDQSFTCTGTSIAVVDRWGILENTPEQLEKEGWTLEGAWSLKGLHCLSTPRYEDCAKQEAVKRAPQCTPEMLAGPEILLRTYRRGKNEIPGGLCPNLKTACR